MGADDYYTIAAKILVHLYKAIKTSKPIDMGYLMPGTEDFPITLEYFLYVLEMMQRQGFIEGLFIQRAYGGIIYQSGWSKIRILPAGIDYLRENTTVRKICETLKEATPIASLFM